MGTVTVTVDVLVVLWDSFTPSGPAVELDVVDIDTCVDDVGSYTFPCIIVVQVLVERAQVQMVSVRNSCQTPRSVVLCVLFVRVNDGVFFDKVDDWQGSNEIDQFLVEVAEVAVQQAVDAEGVQNAVGDGVDVDVVIAGGVFLGDQV